MKDESLEFCTQSRLGNLIEKELDFLDSPVKATKEIRDFESGITKFYYSCGFVATVDYRDQTVFVCKESEDGLCTCTLPFRVEDFTPISIALAIKKSFLSMNLG